MDGNHGAETIKMDQEIPGEEAALTQGMHAAVSMLAATGGVTPTVIALVREGSGWRGLWQMDVSQAVQRGNEGLHELGFVLAKLVSPTGCDLSAMGVKPEHFKADAVVVVVEGKANGGLAGDAPQEWRSLSVELRTDGRACAVLYRLIEQGNEVVLEFVGRTLEMNSPLDQGSAAPVLH